MKNNIYSSFYNAIKGVLYCILNERNMRIHLVITFYVLAFSFFFDFCAGEYALLFVAIVSVIFSEMINTAIERITDYIMPKQNKYAAIAKDVSAGAVLFSAVLSVFAGIYLFLRFDKIEFIFDFFFENILFLIFFILSLAVSVWFIFFLRLREPKQYSSFDK